MNLAKLLYLIFILVLGAYPVACTDLFNFSDEEESSSDNESVEEEEDDGTFTPYTGPIERTGSYSSSDPKDIPLPANLKYYDAKTYALDSGFSDATGISYEPAASFDNSNNADGGNHNSNYTADCKKIEWQLLPTVIDEAKKYHDEYKVFNQGRVSVILNFRSHDMGAKEVAMTATVFDKILAYLGVEFPYDCVVFEATPYTITRKKFKLYGEPAEGLFQSVESSKLKTPNYESNYDRILEAGNVLDRTFMVEAIFHDTLLPRDFTLGLIRYLQDEKRIPITGKDFERNIQCLGDRFGYSSDKDQLMSMHIEKVPSWYAQIAGACFWYWIEKRYGHKAFQKIMHNLLTTKSDPKAGFIKDVINPAVGEDVGEIIKNTWGSYYTPELNRADSFDNEQIAEGVTLTGDASQERKCKASNFVKMKLGEKTAYYGRMVATGPAVMEDLLPAFAEGNATSFNGVSHYLGIDLDAPCVLQILSVSSTSRGGSAGSSLGKPPQVVFMNVSNSLSGWQRSASEFDEEENKIFRTDLGGNNHEMTHVLVHNLPLPLMLNEGLATYMESSRRANDKKEISNDLYCFDKTMRIPSFSGGPVVMDLLPLQHFKIGGDTPEIYFYYSAYCFWDYLERTYGHAILQKVIEKLVENRCKKGVHFVKDILNPVVGEDISAYLYERWGEEGINMKPSSGSLCF